MSIDPSNFTKFNVTDTCAIWNLLSSEMLYTASKAAGCVYCCTDFVHYECVIKPRTIRPASEDHLREKYWQIAEKNEIPRFQISLDDLQEVARLQARKKISLGEISSMLFAKQTRQGFLTDDQGARRLAETLSPMPPVQTTPHLLAWLHFEGHITSEVAEEIIVQHEVAGRPLKPHLSRAIELSNQCRANAVPKRSAP